MEELNELKREDVARFILGGHATIVFQNTETKNQWRFTIRHIRDTDRDFSVYVDSPIDKFITTDYFRLIGYIDFRSHHFKPLGHTALGNRAIKRQNAIDSFDYVWYRLLKDIKLPDKLKFFHIGKCCVCGRTLKDAESIKKGIGPECEKNLK